MQTILITGGSGFIGSALVRELLNHTACRVVNIDKLTYAASPDALEGIQASDRYRFVQEDVAAPEVVEQVIGAEQPDCVFHLAAESHVDRSIDSPEPFVTSNVLGTFEVLEACRQHHVPKVVVVSTDEVFGEIDAGDVRPEAVRYRPGSPYAATKASGDHLAMAWHRTYGLPIILTHSCNNFGLFQHPEKLIPKAIECLRSGEPIPIYGNGQQQRDWLWVDDHVQGLLDAAELGEPGKAYHFGFGAPVSNLELIETLCDLADEHQFGPVHPARQLITFVDDRPGHDFGYWMPLQETREVLGWQPTVSLRDGLRRLL